MRKIVGGLLLSAFAFAFIGENPVQKKIIDRLAAYHKILPQEKVYLHSDKPYYHPGDTLWFKGYLADAMNHFPDSASKVLYVDFIDLDRGRLLLTKMLRVDNGFTYGNFELPDSLKEGSYQVRSYTNWMRNFPESFFFKREVRVYLNKRPSYGEETLAKLNTIADLQFFPEGGDLINDITGRIAFKAVNISGQGIEAKGFILNNKKDTVTTFRSSHLGMGYFMLKPAVNETYSAFVTDVKNTPNPFPLPRALEEGYAMALDNLSRKDEIKVFVSHNFKDKKDITLIAHERGKIYYAADAQVAKGSFQIRVPKVNFPGDGIIHFTLFDRDGLPHCERLVFLNTDQALTVEFNTDKEEYKPREKVELQIQIEDAKGDPVKGNFSLAVTDGNQVSHEPYDENIYTYLLLNSEVETRHSEPNNPREISGYIEQPGCYFDKNNNTRATDLDVLLMTQGWRRFLWKDVLTKTSYDTAFAIETGMRVTGKVTQPKGQPTKQPVSLTMMLTPASGGQSFQEGQVGRDGRFLFDNLDFFGPASMLIQGVKTNKGRNLSITFDSLATPPEVKLRKQLTEALWVENSILENFLKNEKENAEIQKSIQANKKVHLLDPVVVKGQRIDEDNRRGLLPPAEKGYALEVDTKICSSVLNAFQILQGRFGGVRVGGNLTNGMYAIVRVQMTAQGTLEPLYLLNGIPVEGTAINSLFPCEIEKIEVFTRPMAIWGSRGTNGVVAFFTRRDGGPSNASTGTGEGLAKLKRMGYGSPREFYSPRYDQNSKSTTPDHRSTLFWMPEIKTNAHGMATVEFWNSDEKNTKMKLILEGMSFDGKIAAGSFTYSVK